MNQSISKGVVGIGLIIFIAAVVVLLNLNNHVSAQPLLQAGLPIYGWSVCQDLGLIPYPGGGGDVQQLIMCTGSGWRVQTYCTEPNKPPPVLNTVCSMVNSTDFWCGDTVQLFRLLNVLQTPPPPTPTFTPTLTPTFTPTQTSTALPSQTPPPSSTPGVTRTAAQDTPQSTAYVRPHPGGPGNLQLVASILSIFFGAILMGVTVLMRIRKTDSTAARK
jgi:hypothetical protein